MQTSQANAIAELRALASRLYPDKPALASTVLPQSLATVWTLLSGAAGVSQQQFAQAIAQASGLTVARNLNPDPAVVKLLPEAFARAQCALPLYISNERCVTVLANPCDEELKDQIAFATRRDNDFVVAPPEDIELAIHVAYSNLGSHTITSTGKLVIQAEKADDQNENVIINLAQGLLQEAIRLRASDLHIQPFSGGGAVRVRVDSMLRRIALLPDNVYHRICRYFKAQSGMFTSKERIAQDGRMSLTLVDHAFDLRVSSLPSRGGERIVIRFLDQSRNFSLSGNGFSLAEIQSLRRLSRNSAGLVLITGPTGSGKTTTLYALLQELNQVHRNIMTVEDPIEYTLMGLSQVETDDAAGLTFASALRSALRQDPDVLLIGEIRDQETAQIAFQAALTGHLVFSTLHTNDALSSIPRLLDLRVHPSILSEALVAVVAQRLCRKLCPLCRQPVEAPLLNEEQVFKGITKIEPAYRAVGCEACGFSGYMGRLPITEILELDQTLRDDISAGRSGPAGARPAQLNNLQSLSSSAARHVISGDTTVAEVYRVIGQRLWRDLAAEYQVEATEIPAFQPTDGASGSSAVLILGCGESFEEQLAIELQNAWFEVYRAYTADEARQQLEKHDNIVHVVVNLDDSQEQAALVAFIHEARVAMAWSRLPALLLLPARHTDLEQALVADGATSPCLIKPVLPRQVVTCCSDVVRGVLQHE